MKRFGPLLSLAAALSAAQAQTTTVQDLTHPSQVLGESRAYRLYLPPAYAKSQKRYPVIYWLHGYEQSSERDAYAREIAAYVAARDVIVADTGPVETVGPFPLYLPELVELLDRTLRTVPDRDHRAVTGYSAGGFMAFFEAAKYPDLFGSASSFMGPTEYSAGPKRFDVEWNAEDYAANLEGVRTRLLTGSRDFIRFYHRRLNAIWTGTRDAHETEDFDSEHGFPNLAKTFDFHLHAFANPLPKPAIFTHADVYPNFEAWGWEVDSTRRQPGVTVLENVSASGFRSSVREWIPGGAPIPAVKLTITSPPRLYVPASIHPVTVLSLRDGSVKRASLKADAQGRLTFDLDGDACEIGIGSEPLLRMTGYEIEDAAWATASQPLKLRVKFANLGGARSTTAPISWESPDPAVRLDSATGRVFGLAPGESGSVLLTLTVAGPARAAARIVAVIGTTRWPIDLRVFPPAAASKNFLIADGRALDVFQHATTHGELTLGDGNGDGHAAPGESFAILIPDGEPFRAAELFSSDACVDVSERASDSWSDYDHTGASVKYTLARIRPECQSGRTVHMLARQVFPNAPEHTVRYYAIEFPIWYRVK